MRATIGRSSTCRQSEYENPGRNVPGHRGLLAWASSPAGRAERRAPTRARHGGSARYLSPPTAVALGTRTGEISALWRKSRRVAVTIREMQIRVFWTLQVSSLRGLKHGRRGGEPVRFRIDDVFTCRGTVVAGFIEGAAVRAGDGLRLIRRDRTEAPVVVCRSVEFVDRSRSRPGDPRPWG